RCPTGWAACRRRTSTCRCSRAGCWTASSPASTSPTTRKPTRRTGHCVPWPTTPPARHSSRSAPTTATDSTSLSRGRMRPSSSGSDPGLFGAVLARGGAADEVTDGAWLAALLEVEAALAAAAADIGIVERSGADAVAAACSDVSAYDVHAIG